MAVWDFNTMSDYSADYTSSKKAKIFIGNKTVVIDFKPFIESLSFEKKSKVIEFKSFFETIPQKDGVDVSRKITFKVIAADYNEAVSNHKKFQKLLRMVVPKTEVVSGDVFPANVSQIYVKFSNLISNYKPTAKDSYSFDALKTDGLLCSVSGVEYKPEMDLGFFDEGGLLFAKAFTIDLDLTVVDPQNKKLTVSKKQEIQGRILAPSSPADMELAKKELASFTPGSLFGFKTPQK